MAKFKGGPIYQNSGGFGPDDYLLKPIKGGRWTRVNFLYGRNSTGDRDIAIAERFALNDIFPIMQYCVSDNAQRWERGKDRIPVMSGTEFWEKYKDAQNWRCVYSRVWVNEETGERYRA